MKQQQSSPLARICLALYLALIAYGSLYPLSSWHDAINPPLAYLTLSMPRYWTRFDALTNVLAYIPLGVLTVFACYPYLRRGAALLAAVLLGGLLSGSVEALQSFLPSRVPSNLDLATNILGSFCGALLGVWQTRAFLDHGYLHLLRKRWFVPAASRGLLALGLWPLAQLYPQAYLFGHGQVLPLISDWLSLVLDMPVDLGTLMFHGGELTTQQFWLAEVVITACGLCGAVLSMLWMLRAPAPRLALILLLTGSALASKTLASALVFGQENSLLWWTPGAQGGLLIGILMLYGLNFAPPKAQRKMAAFSLLLALVAINLVPSHPYFAASLQTWVQGKFINFNGAAQALALLWPMLALWCISHPDRHIHDKSPSVPAQQEKNEP